MWTPLFLRCTGFSLQWLLLLHSTGSRRMGFRSLGSVVGVHVLSCPVACGLLVPGPGIKPTSPTLQDRFPTITRKVPQLTSASSSFLPLLHPHRHGSYKHLLRITAEPTSGSHFSACHQRLPPTPRSTWLLPPGFFFFFPALKASSPPPDVNTLTYKSGIFLNFLSHNPEESLWFLAGKKWCPSALSTFQDSWQGVR